MQDVTEQHKIRIAKATLRLSDAGAFILGGMTKDHAREVLTRNGWTAGKIAQFESALPII